MKINQIKNVVLPLLLLFCLIGCSEDKEPQTYPPTLVTNSAAELTRFEALLSGSVVPHANSVVKAEVFFLFAKGNTLVDAEEFTATPDNTTEGRYVCTIDGLTPGNEYCYSICARSGGSIAKGEVIKFETLSSTAPVPAATIATNINENGALLSSDITDNGGQNVTQRGFAYKVYQEGMPEPTTSDKTRSVSLEAETFSVQISDLQAKTKYIVRAFAINKAGTGYGEAVTFTTEELKIPQLTCSMGTVTAFAATPSATVSTNGGFKLTEYGFCWSTESQVPTIENLKTVTGNSETANFSEVIEDLNPETTYYLRAYATNEKGTGYSNILTFKTEQKQVATLTKPEASKIEVTSATLSSTITVPSGVEVTEKGICYSIFSTKPATDGQHTVDSSQGNAISVNLKDLNEGATYYATAYATTRDGTFYSEATQFTLGRTYEPTVAISEVTGVGETEATVNATIKTDGGRDITEKGICWSSTSSTPTLENDAFMKAEGTGNNFSLKLTSLTKGQKYYVRAYAKNVNGTGYSPAFEFTTALTKAPEVVNMAMTAVHDDHSTAQAVISDKGGLEITEKGFVYSTTVVSPTIGAEGVLKVISKSTDDTFTAELTGLTYQNRYYICAYATNAKGTSYSSATNFFTSTSSTPNTNASVKEGSIGSTTATMEGKIASDGGDGSEELEISEVGFCWSENTSEPTIDKDSHVKATLDKESKTFTVNLTGLKAYTYYYVRAYAKNKNGVGYSYYTTFRTERTTPEGDDNVPPGTTTKSVK